MQNSSLVHNLCIPLKQQIAKKGRKASQERAKVSKRKQQWFQHTGAKNPHFTQNFSVNFVKNTVLQI